ncbi:MAG: mechanosensitive ion channel family protein [Candidatus Bathyarchaeota archaeon]|nr:mechanosensitive ion channel family protein [Candidatus Bathyarchaeota archaeon]
MAEDVSVLGFFVDVYGWIDENILGLITTGTVLVALYIVYKFLIREIDRLKEKEVLDISTASLFKKILKWTSYIIISVLIFNTLGIQIDFFLGLWVLAGGTIIGFASMNTIGNALAGLIIMASRPFKIRDRLFFQDQFVIVEDIDLIYTRMRTLDNVVISVPNQLILESVIANQSVYDIIRRRIVVTIDYSEKPERIKEILLTSTKDVEEIIAEPAPYVWITDFPNYAMEYTLFYYIGDTQKSQMIDAKVREAVINEFTKNGIDMSTPNLIKSMS